MQNGYPCPNPTCSQVFPLTAVAGASVLTCPKCGTRFQFRTAAPVAPPAAPAPAAPVPNYPMSRPAPGAPPPPGMAVPAYPAAPVAAQVWGATAPPVARAVAPAAASALPQPPFLAAPAAQPQPFLAAPAPVPAGTNASAFALDSQPEIGIRPPRRRSGGGVGIYVVLLVIAGAIAGGAYYAYTKGIRFQAVLPVSTEREEKPTPTEPAAIETDTLTGTRAYTVRVRKGSWKKDDVAKKDYKADLAVQLADRAAPNDPASRASLMVIVLPRVENLEFGVVVAKDKIKEREKSAGADFRVEVVKDESGAPFDSDGTIGDTTGHITKLYVREAETRQRYVVLGIIARPDNLLVVQCECAWDKMRDWDETFEQILSSVRVKVKK